MQSVGHTGDTERQQAVNATLVLTSTQLVLAQSADQTTLFAQP